MYYPVAIENCLTVDKIVTVHYFEYPKDFCFSGESHDFWEFLYVDKGQVYVDADEERHLLKQGEMIFHKPMEWHTVYCDGKVAPNLVVASFVASGHTMNGLGKQIIKIDNLAKQYLSDVLKEAIATYQSDLSDPHLNRLIFKATTPIGSAQMLKNHLENLLIHILRCLSSNKSATQNLEPLNTIQMSNLDMTIARIEHYIDEHLDQKITLYDICRHTLVSQATIARCIKKRHHMSVMTFVEKAKIEVAKTRIREGQLMFGQLALSLGYSNANHFGKVFKKHLGMTLSEYARTLIK